MKKSIYAYPWDFADEGIGTVLEALRSNGVTGLYVAAAYHAGKFIFPHNPKRRVYFPEDGVVYFSPDAKYYQSTPLKPVCASLATEGDLLRDIFERCKDFEITPAAWLVCLHNSRLGMQHPQCTTKNVFGDSYPHSLCPARAEVVEYVKGLVSDVLDNYPLARVFLESLSYMGFLHGYHHEFYGVKVDSYRASLLSLCFCDACRSEAAEVGVDADRVAEVVRGELTMAFAQEPANGESPGQDGSWDRFLGLVHEHAELAAFMDVRCKLVTRLVSDVRRIVDGHGAEMDFFGPVFMPSCRQAVVEGIRLDDIARLVDHYVVDVSGADLAEVQRDLEFVEETVESKKIVASLKMGWKSTPSKRNFTDKVGLARAQGLHRCNFYNYGTIPLHRLAWIGEIG